MIVICLCTFQRFYWSEDEETYPTAGLTKKLSHTNKAGDDEWWAAKTICRYLFIAYTDPNYEMCQRRLKKEFIALV
jgi:predicted hydrolase (HD superfamily)